MTNWLPEDEGAQLHSMLRRNWRGLKQLELRTAARIFLSDFVLLNPG
jgi:hypothetical protein